MRQTLIAVANVSHAKLGRPVRSRKIVSHGSVKTDDVLLLIAPMGWLMGMRLTLIVVASARALGRALIVAWHRTAHQMYVLMGIAVRRAVMMRSRTV